jgi:DUF917 family protein
MPFARAVGLTAVIVCPIVYGIIGGIAAVIGALIYNLASGLPWVESKSSSTERSVPGTTMITFAIAYAQRYPRSLLYRKLN